MHPEGPRKGARASPALGGGLRRIGRHLSRRSRDASDAVVRGLLAGLSAREVRAMLRGDRPTERPSPRYKAQDRSFLLHIRPKHYQRASTWFTHTWRLGWLAGFLFFVEVVTGVALMVFYSPTPGSAYGAMEKIIGGVPFGSLVRDLHRLGAEAMVAVVALHMARVYVTGSYKGPRRFTWLCGVVLLLLTLALSFSGYLLPWDQLGYWAVTVGTSMARAAPVLGQQANLLLRGAANIGASGLLRFYLLHVAALPLGTFLFLGVHYYKVARDHSISLPAGVEEGDMDEESRRRAEERVDFLPDLLLHELMLVSLTVFLMVAAVATVYHAPLEAHADPEVTPLHATAPWYFLWLQGMLKLGSTTVMGVLVPTVVVLVLFAVPWLDRNPYRLARRRKVAVGVGVLSVVAVALLSFMGTPAFGIRTPAAEDLLSRFVPDTGAGPTEGVPWSQLATAPNGGRKTYLVSYPASWETDPKYSSRERYEFVKVPDGTGAQMDEFQQVLARLKSDVENEPTLLPPVDRSAALAVVTVENYTPDLKWLVFTLTWDEVVTDPVTGEAISRVDPATGLATVTLKRDLGPDGRPEQLVKRLAIHRDR